MRTLAGLPLALAILLAAPAAAAPTGEGVTVAVLDSGVDRDHPELEGRVERAFFTPLVPGSPLDPGQAVPDPNGQGTAVASLVAGATLGLAPEARILDLQVSATYSGTTLDPAAEQAAIQAMDYLLQDPGRAQVVLLSFAARGVSPAGAHTLARQAEGLWDAGVLVVVPAANALSSLHESPSVLTIGAPNCPHGTSTGSDQVRKPDLVAPDRNLRAAAPGTPANPGPTTTVSGTAHSAAQAAGAAALMLDARRDLPVDATASLLRATSADLGDPGVDDCHGFGLLTPEAAVAAAQTWRDPVEQFPEQEAPGPALPLALLAVAAAVALRRRA